MAHNYGLFLTNNGLLLAIVAHYFQLPGCPGGPYKVIEDLHAEPKDCDGRKARLPRNSRVPKTRAGALTPLPTRGRWYPPSCRGHVGGLGGHADRFGAVRASAGGGKDRGNGAPPIWGAADPFSFPSQRHTACSCGQNVIVIIKVVRRTTTIRM